MIFIKKNYIVIILITILIFISIFLGYHIILENENIEKNIKINEVKEENKMLLSIEQTEEISNNVKDEVVFSSFEIPDNILDKMIGNSIPKENAKDIKIDSLSYLKITYWGFDEKSHIGEMVVNRKVAQEVLDIFEEIYESKYPIEKIRLIDEYGANDEKSMQDNNTSAFCYRVVKNSKKLSNHSLGTAIDVNPLYNPYVDEKQIQPANAGIYVNRNANVKGIIKKGDALYNAFIKRGWKWGGNWKTKKDYQHFEKEI